MHLQGCQRHRSVACQQQDLPCGRKERCIRRRNNQNFQLSHICRLTSVRGICGTTERCNHSSFNAEKRLCMALVVLRCTAFLGRSPDSVQYNCTTTNTCPDQNSAALLVDLIFTCSRLQSEAFSRCKRCCHQTMTPKVYYIEMRGMLYIQQMPAGPLSRFLLANSTPLLTLCFSSSVRTAFNFASTLHLHFHACLLVLSA